MISFDSFSWGSERLENIGQILGPSTCILRKKRYTWRSGRSVSARPAWVRLLPRIWLQNAFPRQICSCVLLCLGSASLGWCSTQIGQCPRTLEEVSGLFFSPPNTVSPYAASKRGTLLPEAEPATIPLVQIRGFILLLRA